MKEGLLYIYRVRHPEYGEIEVKAQDRLRAICAAAKAWGIRWTAIARACSYERIGPAPAPEKKKAASRKHITEKKTREER